MQLRIASIGMLIATVIGCGVTETPPEKSADSNPAPANALILSPSALDEAFLIALKAPLRWRFLGDEFVVESWNEPLPMALQERMLETSGAVYRIGGHWRLLDGGRRLHLTHLQADGPVAKSEADISIDEGQGDSLLVAETACQLIGHPDNREILPDDRFRAHFSLMETGHLVQIEHGGKVETLRLGGILCPPADHPLGRQAMDRAETLMRGMLLQVKVYDSPPQDPRHAQFFTLTSHWINLQLIEEGLAWHDKPHDHQWLFASREDGAREKRLGIWGQSDLYPPWWKAPVKQCLP